MAGSSSECWVWGCGGRCVSWCNISSGWGWGVLWDWGGCWLNGDGAVDDSWDTGADGDDAQAWGISWDLWLIDGGLSWVGWGEGGVVVDWDGGGGDIAGGRGDSAVSRAVGDSSVVC